MSETCNMAQWEMARSQESFAKMYHSLGVVVLEGKGGKVACLRANLMASKAFFHLLSSQVLFTASERSMIS